ncbi:MAG: hypothetical protein Q9159_004367 [Coniocarpon cinnabarinum]
MDASNATQTTFGVLSLVDTCVRGFRSARLSASFQTEYDTCLIKLDLACWNLAKWYQLCGTERLQTDATCIFFLSEINKALTEARDLSRTYERENNIDPQSQLGTISTIYYGTCQNAIRLRRHLEEQIRGGAKSTNIGTRMLWVLYRHEELDALVRNVTEKIHHLVTCFPPEPRDALDNERAGLLSCISSMDQLSLLKDAASDTDRSLATLVDEKETELAKNTFVDFTISGDDITVGDDYEGPESHPKTMVGAKSFNKFVIGGYNPVIGNRFRGGPERRNRS